MKVVIQQGEHVNRNDIESFLKMVPAPWLKAIKGITIYESISEIFKIEYYAKTKILGVHISRNYEGKQEDSFEKIAVALQAINEFDYLPTKISRSREKSYIENWHQELA